MKIQVLALAAMVSVLILGCGKRSTQRGIIKDAPSANAQIQEALPDFQIQGLVKTYNTPEEAEDIWQKVEIKCDSASVCSSGVGALVSVNGGQLTICTATLISEDTVLAHSKCISPSYISKKGQNKKGEAAAAQVCGDGNKIVFPEAQGVKAEEVACGDIEQPKAKAYAGGQIVKIKLKKKMANRDVLKLPGSGNVIKIQQDSVLTAITLRAASTDDAITITQLRQSCMVTFKTRSLYQDSSEGPQIRLKDCGALTSSLGAPLFSDTENKTWAGVVTGFSHKNKGDFQKYSERLGVENAKPYAVGVLASCIFNDDAKCALERVKSEQRIRGRLESEFQEKWSQTNLKVGTNSKAYLGKVTDYRNRKNGEEIFKFQDTNSCKTWTGTYEINSNFEEGVSVKSEPTSSCITK